jgi:hypothetical protein
VIEMARNIIGTLLYDRSIGEGKIPAVVSEFDDKAIALEAMDEDGGWETLAEFNDWKEFAKFLCENPMTTYRLRFVKE